jgi:hypothetical protein
LLKLTANEKGITREDSFVLSVFHKEADAVLSVARCMHTLEGDVAELEGLAVTWCLRNTIAVFAANNVYLGVVQLSKLVGVNKFSWGIILGGPTSFLLPPA